MDNIAVEWNRTGYFIKEGFFLHKKYILNDLDLSVPKGTCLGLVGPNGAGKTTIIKLGVGLIKPSQGSVNINGKSSYLADSRKSVGFLSENQYVYPHLKLFEWLEMLGKLSGVPENRIKSEVDRVLQLVELGNKASEKLKILSKGQTQRAGLAQALMNSPSILFLDEPMSGLDPVWRYKFKEILLGLKSQGVTIIFSSHIISDILNLSDKIAYIESGSLKWYGRINEMRWKNKKYQAVFYSDSFADVLKKEIEYIKLEKNPDKSWLIVMDTSKKEQFFDLVLKNNSKIELFSPVYIELEAFFGENLF
ncbi:MAG: multidrug ABC transporter ATP-binding protein [Deltaproteobacteria bacterium]|nr:MAG: multidrug ABC transporter ATP-binding protein [Deltaproteobacteria bacterium]PIE74702.1 MAG: multidrug ABC transporter ATP-binding protein [Deltaproteobacteria bacterium]